MRLGKPLRGDWPVSQPFGARPAYYATWEWAGHPGRDYACPVGTPVLAKIDGWCEPRYDVDGWGDYVTVRSSDGEWMTLQAHLDRATVVFGQWVKVGDVIALSGNSGNSDGPHLHDGVQWTQMPNPRFRDWINPLSWMEEREVGYKTGIQWQHTTGWSRAAVAKMGSVWQKLINPPRGCPDPFSEVACKDVRIHTDAWDRAYIARGYQGGIDYVERLLPAWVTWPWATAKELPNEPDVNTNPGIANLCGFTLGAMSHATKYGHQVIWGNWAEGNPHDNNTGDISHTIWKVRQFAEVAREGIRLGHIFGRHYYWRPQVGGPLDEFHALGRLENDVKWWAEAGVPIDGLRVLATECGIDGGIGGHTKEEGWRHMVAQGLTSRADYIGQIVTAERRAQELPWLEGQLLFVAGYEGQWAGFDLAEREVLDIGTALHTMVPPTPPAPSDGQLTEAHIQRAREMLGTWPATMKDAREHGEVWILEDPDGPQDGVMLYISEVPTNHRFQAVLLDGQTWQRLDVQPL